MIMSFDIIIELVKMLGRVDLTFEHYIVTTKTLINKYLIVPKMFLETDEFGDPSTVGQIDTCVL